MIRFFVKCIIFLFIIFVFESAANLLIPHESPQPKEVTLLKNYLKENVEVIYFGDSSATNYSYQDQNKNPIQGFLAENLKEYQVGAITHPAYMMDIYEKYVKYIINHNQAVKVVIIPINLRSFSKEIEENPMNKFRKAKIYLDYPSPILNIFYQPMAAFKVFEVGETNISKNPNDNMARQLTLRYMYKLSPNQKGVEAMRRLIKDLKGSNVKALFYITPVDYQAASQYVGKEFEEKVSQNILLIKETLVDQQNIDLLDLSFTLNHDSFNWPEIYMDEHLKETGRRFVAQQLANYINNKLNEN